MLGGTAARCHVEYLAGTISVRHCLLTTDPGYVAAQPNLLFVRAQCIRDASTPAAELRVNRLQANVLLRVGNGQSDLQLQAAAMAVPGLNLLAMNRGF